MQSPADTCPAAQMVLGSKEHNSKPPRLCGRNTEVRSLLMSTGKSGYKQHSLDKTLGEQLAWEGRFLDSKSPASLHQDCRLPQSNVRLDRRQNPSNSFPQDMPVVKWLGRWIGNNNKSQGAGSRNTADHSPAGSLGTVRWVCSLPRQDTARWE